MDSVATMNFDGLVGPNHNYAGLSHGNVASATNAHQTSRPREAVLQGLTKMAKLSALGVPQGVLPPLERPRLDVLRGLGFAGDDAAILQAASKSAPTLFHAIWSASAMWTANADDSPGSRGPTTRPPLRMERRRTPRPKAYRGCCAPFSKP